MTVFWFLVYNIFAVPIQYLIFHIVAPFNAKVRRGIIGRRRLKQTLKEFNASRDRGANCYVVHCASHGEYEMAKPVIEEIKRLEPETVIILTFFSPSGYEQVKENSPADLVTYLPFDSGRSVADFLNLINPDKLILTSYEIWPNLIWIASRFGIDVYLTSARLSGTSKKLLPVIRSFYKTVYGSIPYIYPITIEDAKILRDLTDNHNINTFGNTRYDRVLERANNASDQTGLPDSFQHSPTLICGSIWPPDNRVVLPAFTSLLGEFENLKLVLAPHETSEDHIEELCNWCDKNNFLYTVYSNMNGTEARVLIVDEIGMLAELYHDGDVAFVGGGFNGSVHNVMEPAVARCAVLFGPDHQNSDEATQLIRENGGKAVASTDQFRKIVRRMLSDESELQKMQDAAYKVIESNAGATQKTVSHILQHQS